jgi:hypothetical protein
MSAPMLARTNPAQVRRLSRTCTPSCLPAVTSQPLLFQDNSPKKSAKKRALGVGGGGEWNHGSQIDPTKGGVEMESWTYQGSGHYFRS